MTILSPDSGEMTSRLRAEYRLKVSDGYGGRLDAWAPLAGATNIPAKVQEARGGEEVRGQRLAGISNFDIVIPATSATKAITTAHRLVDTRNPNRTFNVKWVGDLNGSGRFLVVACQMGGHD